MKYARVLSVVAVLLGMVGGGANARGQLVLSNIAHLNNGVSAQAVTTQVTNLFLADFSAGMFIYNITNPSNLLFLSKTNNTGNVGSGTDIAVAGAFAYFADEFDGLRIYNISNPFSPTNVGYASDTNLSNAYASSVAVFPLISFGVFAAVANGFDGVRIYNVNTPSNPVTAGVISNGNYANGITIVAPDAYVADSTGGLVIYDLSNPSSPFLVGSTNNGGTANGVAVQGSFAYVANGNDGLRVYDISNPSHPVNVGHTNSGGSALNVFVSGNFAYLANYTDGLRVYDITTPSHPIAVGSAPAGGGTTYDVTVLNNFAYVANGDDGLRVYSVAAQSTNYFLSVSRTNNNTVLISWPAPSPGLTLKQNPALVPNSWAAVTNVPVTNGATQTVTISATAGKDFYRLSSP